MTLVDTETRPIDEVAPPATEIHGRLARHILADGLPYVMDVDESQIDEILGL